MGELQNTVPKVRFKGFSDNFSKKEIIEVADYVDYRGKTPAKTEQGILLVTAKNIKFGFLDYDASKEYIDEKDFDVVMSRGKVAINDVLITTEAPIGNVACVDRNDIALAQRVIKYRGKLNILDNIFLKQIFLSDNFQKLLLSKATGGTVKGIKGSVLHKLKILIPIFQEQTQIGNFFQKLDKLIELSQTRLEQAKTYKKAMLQKMFPQQGESVPQIRFKGFGKNWSAKKLADLGIIISGVGFPEIQQKGKKGIPFYKVSDMNNRGNEIVMNISNNYVTEKQVTDYKWKIIDNIPAIIFAKVGAAVMLNRKRLVEIPFLIDNNLMAYSFDLSSWSTYFCKVFFDTLYLPAFIQTGALPSINGNDIKLIKIKIPSIEEQTQIGNFFQKLDQRIEHQTRKLEHYQQLKKALLQRMFV